MVIDVSVLIPCSESALRMIDNRWMEGSVSEMCHL